MPDPLSPFSDRELIAQLEELNAYLATPYAGETLGYITAAIRERKAVEAELARRFDLKFPTKLVAEA